MTIASLVRTDAGNYQPGGKESPFLGCELINGKIAEDDAELESMLIALEEAWKSSAKPLQI